jgi:hypothetical protein
MASKIAKHRSGFLNRKSGLEQRTEILEMDHGMVHHVVDFSKIQSAVINLVVQIGGGSARRLETAV